ncbi:uncharacterized protein LOC119325043 [Triticum dicoccoides]|uniref:uncharacterized protein LOC119325043 n=1 Tax=Triticum dicoccoides TaxID=85692 RepID=UPI001891B012|nr:uncharacterized protein LOC119325043 [Triticum dicoccoides]XP_037454695.1 uncharacterized protein LOC119325043 [Triticum dicoccoides]
MEPRPPPSPSPPQASPSSAVRVLSRAPPPASAPSPAAVAASPPHDGGVVVVGFVGVAGGAAARLADRILDAPVFSPGGSARTLAGGVRYHRDADRRMVFLHLASPPPPPPPPREPGGGSTGGLPEMLFMFSVCHVIVFLQEGFRFDTQILKNFRLLQSSKHAFAPFVRSLVAPGTPSKAAPSGTPGTPSKATPSGTPTRPTRRASSISPPARRGGHSGRQPSAISLMSGTGSHASVLPGQCIPVVLFVFEDDIIDGPSVATSVDDMGETSSSNQASGTSKGSGSVVMLARPPSKSEGSFTKKLHLSLEGQIRFLLKRCRTLTGLESSGHNGPRGAGNVSHLPLFSLDPSRVVALLDRSINKKQEPLDIIAGLFEDSFSSKSSLDVASLENNCQCANHEDVQLIKDFIFRQSDGLRGKGGYSGNAPAGSVAGVGMVAAAAAAAAASASSGKPVSVPDLPSFDKWFSVSTSILSELISAKDGIDNSESMRGSSTHTSSSLKNEKSSAIETALSCLESNKGLNMKFCSSWCQKVLPVAKEVYLKDLPDFYPTSVHEMQLQKALRSFHSTVKGPAVKVFSKKLEDDCKTIWEAGRQQCDAVSLTGRPCKHQRHGKLSSSDAVEQHSSGYVFLHACACGRSRRLRDDPFDFETANVSFNCFSNCEDLLPTLVLPRGVDASSFPASSWRLVRLGGARYYKPTKGLLQAGFCSKDKYLLKWTISLGKGQGKNGTHAATKSSSMTSNMNPQIPPAVSREVKPITNQVAPEIRSAKLENPRKQPEVQSTNNSAISFGKGHPNFTMKKPFAEVVAGSTTKDSEFPALQLKRPPKPASRKDERQVSVAEQTNGRTNAALSQGPVAENESEKVSKNMSSETADGKPFLQIGSNMVPVTVGNETKEAAQTVQQFVVYVGFEHECSYGHRFLLSEKYLKEIDYERSYQNNEAESKHSSQKLPPNASKSAATTGNGNNGRKSNRPMESSGRNSRQQLLQPGVDGETLRSAHILSDAHTVRKGEHSLQYITADDGGEAYSLLNRNLPIYMHCPHCKSSDGKGHQDVKAAGAVSQLQRIFIVTPDFPVLLASCPLVQFERSCLPSNVSDRDQQGSFSLGCRVLLPPESFLTLRLPFVYGAETRDGSTSPLKHLEQQPELTAWLVGGTALQIVSAGYVAEKEANVS